jgi:hypothetical protein
MSTKLNTAYITQTIYQRLGGSRRSVELTEADYTEAIEQSLDLWNEYRSRVEFHRQDNIVTSENAPFSVVLDSCVLGVRRVYFLVPYYAVTSGISIFELTEKLTITRLGIKDIALTRSAWDMYRQVRGVQPHWHFDKESDPQKLVFFAPSGPYSAGYELLVPFTDPTQIEKDRDSAFLKLCEGHARLILSDIRGKFGNQVLGPGGKTVALNAERQVTRGEALIEEVTNMLKTSRPNMPVPSRIG